jgi:hypothetical protein
MTIQITINGSNVTPSETLLAAIKAEYPEWPGSIQEARERLKPEWYNYARRNDRAKAAFQDPSNICTPEQANAHAAFGDLLVLMTAINGDYTGWPRYCVEVNKGTLKVALWDYTIVSPIWFKSDAAAEHAIKIAEQEFRLFNGVNEKV